MVNHRSFNILGNIAIVNFSDKISLELKKKFAEQLLLKYPHIKTVLEKSGKFSGRLRKMKTKHLAGEKNKEVASLIKKNEDVLVMFAGVAPYSICIAKNSEAKVYSNEINREANKYAKLNIELNKVGDKVELIPGDIKRVVKKLKSPRPLSDHPPQGNNKSHGYSNIPHKFDVIVMPRPKLKETFLKQAFILSKKGTKIYYYDFCKTEDVDKIAEKIKNEAEKARKKIKILKIKQAGEIAPYKIRVRVDFKII